MTEGAQVDYGGHANDMSYVASEVMDFDPVIGKTMQFADADRPYRHSGAGVCLWPAIVPFQGRI